MDAASGEPKQSRRTVRRFGEDLVPVGELAPTTIARPCPTQQPLNDELSHILNERSPTGKVWLDRDGHTILDWHNVLVTYWRSAATLNAIEICAQASHDIAERFDGRVVCFNIVGDGAPLPNTQVRGRSAELLTATAQHICCSTTIVCGEGFWASAVRAMVATVALFSRARHPQKIFDTIEQGARWVGPYLQPADVGPSQLYSALRRVISPVVTGKHG